MPRWRRIGVRGARTSSQSGTMPIWSGVWTCWLYLRRIDRAGKVAERPRTFRTAQRAHQRGTSRIFRLRRADSSGGEDRRRFYSLVWFPSCYSTSQRLRTTARQFQDSRHVRRQTKCPDDIHPRPGHHVHCAGGRGPVIFQWCADRRPLAKHNRIHLASRTVRFRGKTIEMCGKI